MCYINSLEVTLIDLLTPYRTGMGPANVSGLADTFERPLFSTARLEQEPLYSQSMINEG